MMAEPMSGLMAELKATEHITELGATERWTEQEVELMAEVQALLMAELAATQETWIVAIQEIWIGD